MKLALTGLVAASSGCGESHNIENSTDFVKWSGNITEQSPHFILSYDSKKYPDPQIERVEQWWVGIQTCTGVSIDITDKPLIIEYVTTDKLPPSDSGLGYYLGFIDIDQRFVIVHEMDLKNNRVIDGQITKHELIHYLVHLTGGSAEDNSNHVSPWFIDCYRG